VNLEGDPELFPDSFQLIKAEASGRTSIETLNPKTLSPNWRNTLAETQTLGDDWLQNRRSALLSVPSVPSPESLNYLLNPHHKDAKFITIAWSKTLAYDRRLFQIRSFDKTPLHIQR